MGSLCYSNGIVFRYAWSRLGIGPVLVGVCRKSARKPYRPGQYSLGGQAAKAGKEAKDAFHSSSSLPHWYHDLAAWSPRYLLSRCESPTSSIEGDIQSNIDEVTQGLLVWTKPHNITTTVWLYCVPESYPGYNLQNCHLSVRFAFELM